MKLRLREVKVTRPLYGRAEILGGRIFVSFRPGYGVPVAGPSAPCHTHPDDPGRGWRRRGAMGGWALPQTWVPGPVRSEDDHGSGGIGRHRKALAGPACRPGGTDQYWAGGPAGPDRISPQPCRGVHSGRSRSPMRPREGVSLAQGPREHGVEPRRGCCPRPGHSGPQQGRRGGVTPFRGLEQDDLGRNTMTAHSRVSSVWQRRCCPL